MSTAALRLMSIDQARRHAAHLMQLCAGCYLRWTVAGSIRRGKPQVGDIDHVVIPRFEARGVGLFGEHAADVNLLRERIDHLVAEGALVKALYQHADGSLRKRWGDKHRGVCIDAAGDVGKHEIYTTDVAGYGSTLVTRLKKRGLAHMVGHIRDRCGNPIDATEQTAHEIAGMTWRPPEERTDTNGWD